MNNQNPNIIIQNYNNNLNNHLEDHLIQNKNNQQQDKLEKPFTFKEPLTRLHFIRKVYLLLLIQITIVTLFTFIPLFSTKTKNFLIKTWYLIFIFLIINIFTLIYLLKSQNTKIVPMNYILFFIFSITKSVFYMYLTAFIEPQAVSVLFIQITFLFAALSVFTYITKREFNGYYGFAFVLVVILSIGSVICLFFPDEFFNVVMNCFVCFLLGGFIVYETWNVVIGQGFRKVEVDDFVVGALLLQPDFFGNILKQRVRYNNL